MNFYKLKNGNISFEYDMNIRLERIEQLLGKKQEDLLSAVIGSIIADYISKNYLANSWFIPVMVAAICIIKIAIFLVHKAITIVKALRQKDFSSEKEQLLVQGVFWNKIIPKIIMGMSLINRNETKNAGIKNDYQTDLQIIYIYQARRCFWEASEDMNNYIFSVNEKKLKEYVLILHKEPLLWVCDMSIKYLDYIASALNLNIASQTEKQFYERVKETIKVL